MGCEAVELVVQGMGERLITDEDTRFDIALVGCFCEVSGTDKDLSLVDDDTFRMEASPRTRGCGKGPRIVEDFGEALTGPNLVSEAISKTFDELMFRFGGVPISPEVNKELHG